ncbi:MAG: hypothetical protein IIA88_12425 [Bacteroidetes bacterium]|nr:hypothetical protein [Bacteroidota bacterium]
MKAIIINLKNSSLFLKLTVPLLLTILILTNCETEELQLSKPDTLSLDLKITKRVVFNNKTIDNVKRLWVSAGATLIIKNSTLKFIPAERNLSVKEIPETGIYVETGAKLYIIQRFLVQIQRKCGVVLK